MKIICRIFLIFFLSNLYFPLTAQQYEVVYTQSFETDEPCQPVGHPFENGQCFSEWSNSHGTPTLKSTGNAFDGANNVWMFVACSPGSCPEIPGRGEGIVLDFNFVAGETYQLCYAVRGSDNLVNAGWYLSNFEFDPPSPSQGICDPLNIIPGINETQSTLWPGSLLTPGEDWLWVDDLDDFTPTQDYTKLWIRSDVCEGAAGEDTSSGMHLDSIVIKRKVSLCEQTEANADFIWSLNGASPNIWAYGFVPDNLCDLPQVTWDFGDGQTCIQGSDCSMNGPVVTHQYEFCGTYNLCMEVKMECEDDSLCIFNICKEVLIEENCEDACEKLESMSGLNWSFNGSSPNIYAFTNVPNNICGTTEVRLDFGDGTTSCIQGIDCDSPFPNLALHTYTECGTYDLCMEVEADCFEMNSCVFTTCLEVIIEEGCEIDPCVINAPTLSLDVYYIDKPVWFDLMIEDVTCPIDQIEWSFGDGETCMEGVDCVLDGDKIFHEYADCGNYLVNVTVTDQCGCVYEYERSISICNVGNNERKYNPNNVFTSYPNPFVGRTTIQYFLDVDQEVKVSIIDINGNLIAQPVLKKFQKKGRHFVEYNAAKHPEGIYFCILKGKDFSRIIKLVKNE